MKPRRIVLSLVVVVGLAAALMWTPPLSVQGDIARGSLSPITITLWHYEGNIQPLQQIVDSFQALYPSITVQLETWGLDELREEFIASASAGGGPDLVRAPNDLIGLFAGLGLIRSVDPSFDLNAFVPQAVEAALWRGQHWGVPDIYGNHLMLCYRKGLVPAPPLNTTQLISLGKSLTTGGRYGLVYDESEEYYLMPWLAGFGGWPLDEATSPIAPTLDTPAMVNALQFLRDLRFQHHIMPPGLLNAEAANQLFLSGGAAMIISGDWSLGSYRDELGDDLGVARIPRVSATGLWPQPMTSGKYYMLNANSSAEALAASQLFIEHATSMEGQMVWAQAGYLPALSEALNDPAVQGDAILQASADQATVGRLMPTVGEMRCVWDASGPHMQAVLRNEEAPAQAAAAMQAEAEACVRELHRARVMLPIVMRSYGGPPRPTETPTSTSLPEPTATATRTTVPTPTRTPEGQPRPNHGTWTGQTITDGHPDHPQTISFEVGDGGSSILAGMDIVTYFYESNFFTCSGTVEWHLGTAIPIGADGAFAFSGPISIHDLSWTGHFVSSTRAEGTYTTRVLAGACGNVYNNGTWWAEWD